MGWLSDFFSNPIETTWDTAKQIPGSPEAATSSVIDGSGSDGLSWNPFYQGGPSVWDRGFLGYKLSDQDQEREHGRMFGRAAAAYGTGGYSEVALAPAEVKAHGGNDSDALQASLRGLASAGASQYINGLDLAGQAGIENTLAKGAVNGGLSGAGTAALGGGNSTQVGRAGAKGLLFGGLKNMGSQSTPVYEEGGYSRAPWAQTRDNSMFVDNTGPQSLPTDYNPSSNPGVGFNSDIKTKSSADIFESPALTQFFDKLVPSSPSGWGDMAQGLMGLYGGYRQRRDAQKMKASYGPNRAAYGQQLQQQLARRDAASGRRSDYGGRAVELQAKLADLDSRNAPMMAQLSNQSTMGLANMLQSGLRYGGKAGWFGDKYNPNVPTAPATSTMLPSTWTQPQPTNMDLNYDPTLGRTRYKLGGG